MNVRSGRSSARKTAAAVFAIALAGILLAARGGLFTGGGSGAAPNAAERCGSALSWQEVWQNPEEYRGSTVTVRGTVAGAAYAEEVQGSPTFLNLGRDHPGTPRFEVIIWGDNRREFLAASPRPPEQRYLGKTVCVAGTVRMHEGIPQIELRLPRQIAVAAPGNSH